jgi:hypothetical protein
MVEEEMYLYDENASLNLKLPFLVSVISTVAMCKLRVTKIRTQNWVSQFHNQITLSRHRYAGNTKSTTLVKHYYNQMLLK